MYKYVIRKLNYYAQINAIKINESKILIMGYTFKENCADIRNTQVKKIYNYYKNILLFHIPSFQKNIINFVYIFSASNNGPFLQKILTSSNFEFGYVFIKSSEVTRFNLFFAPSIS